MTSKHRWHFRAGTVVVLALLLLPRPLEAQGEKPSSHRKWVYALVGGVVVGVPAALSASFLSEGTGGCSDPQCFAPIAAVVGATAGFLIGIERDQAAARRHVVGPEASLEGRTIELPVAPVGAIPLRRGALVVGRTGMARVDENLGMRRIPGVRGLAAATVLEDHNLLVGATDRGLYGFPLDTPGARAREIYREGANALAGDGASRLLFGGVGNVRVLGVSGEGSDAELVEEARATVRDVPGEVVWPRGGDVVWSLSRARVEGRAATDLSEVGTLELPAPPLSLKVDRALAVAAAGAQGLYVLDLSIPSRPRLVGRYDGVNYAHDAAVRGTDAWVAAGTQGLISLDLSTPSDPVVTGVVRNLGNPTTVLVGEGGLFVIDGQARELHRVPLSGNR